jgi:hypothetical protein
MTLARLAPIGLAFVVARFPGEWLDAQYGAKKWIPANAVTTWLGATDNEGRDVATSLHDLLFNGRVDYVTRRRRSLFSNTLILPYFDALEAVKVAEKVLPSLKHTLVFRGRHLEGAVFYFADLRKSDFNGAQLQGAELDGAQLQGAELDGAQLQGASLFQAQLQGASLDFAQLQGVWLNFAQLQGASLDQAKLQGASFDNAQLQGASFDLVV